MSGADASRTIALRPALITTTVRYGHTDGSDASMLTLNTAGTVLTRSKTISGGVTVTFTGATQAWSYPNLHGDILARADSAGEKVGTTEKYDPYGMPSQATPGVGYGWLGQHRKLTDPQPGTLLIQMGARTYVPALVSFGFSRQPPHGERILDHQFRRLRNLMATITPRRDAGFPSGASKRCR